MLRSVPLWHPVPLTAITARSQRVLERNPGVDVWMPVLSALAVVNSNHLFSSPSLLPLSFSPLLLFNCPVLPPHPAFLLILWPLSLYVSPPCLSSMLLVFVFMRSLSPSFVLQIPAAAQPGPRAQPCGIWDCGERSSCCQHPCHCS